VPPAFQTLTIPQLTSQAARALLAQRSAKAPAGRSTGFFANEAFIGADASGYAVYYLPYFGYYTYASPIVGARPYPGWLYKYGFGWLYDLGGSFAGAPDVYFYDQDLGFIYTAVGYGSDADHFLYFYDFTTGHFDVYFQSFSFPRYFYDYATGKIFTSPAVGPKSISGDMLALAPNRGWNYHSPINGGVTVSTYVNPTPLSDGSLVYAGTAATGLRTTVLVDHATAEGALLGGLSFQHLSDGYHVGREVSAGSIALVPGNPLFIGNTLVEGATSSPYPGVTETVLNVGPQPGESACGTTRDGAKVQYSVPGDGTWLVSVVPGCGITEVTASWGAVFTLSSTGVYALGDLAKARRVESASVGSTILSIFGRGKQDLHGSGLIK
jgi:hypothetical protein